MCVRARARTCKDMSHWSGFRTPSHYSFLGFSFSPVWGKRNGVMAGFVFHSRRLRREVALVLLWLSGFSVLLVAFVPRVVSLSVSHPYPMLREASCISLWSMTVVHTLKHLSR